MPVAVRNTGRETDPLVTGAKPRDAASLRAHAFGAAPADARKIRAHRWFTAVGALVCVVGAAFAHSYYVAPHTLIRYVNHALGAPTREITFRVYACGIPDDVYEKFLPWPVCRAKLVGCPGGGAGCGHWRYAEGLEMPPLTRNRNAFELKTSAYGTGDVFGFALIEAGCSADDEAKCQADGTHKSCKKGNVCDHRYDSGTHFATNEDSSTTNITCWKWGDGKRCSSASPGYFPIVSHKPGSKYCFKAFGDKWYNRVIPPRVTEISYVWGLCDKEPADMEVCANRDLPSVCEMVETTSDDPIEKEAICKLPNGKPSPDGTPCRVKHPELGSESMSVVGDCCAGGCCPLGFICNKDTGGCAPIPTTLADKEGICADVSFPEANGVCTQSCGSGNDDCDKTCQAAEANGYELDCKPFSSDPKERCICDNQEGHTANECQNSENTGYKCCTCKNIVGKKAPSRR